MTGEQPLHPAVSRLRTLVDHLRIGVLVEDERRMVAMLNEEFCRLFGIPGSPSDLVGADCAQAAEGMKDLFVEPHRFIERIDELVRTKVEVEAEEIPLVDGRVFERDSLPIMDGPEVVGHLWQYRDVTESRERARGLERTNRLLTALGKAQREYIQTSNPSLVFEALLKDLLGLTESEYGFIGEVLLDRGGRYLKTHAITNIAWDRDTRDFYEKNAPTGMEFRNLDTLFGAVMRDNEIVIANEPATDPRSGGLPPGHPDLNAFLGLPFFRGDEMVGMVGIANRPGGYDDEVIQELEPFLATCTSILSAFRTARALESSEHRTGAIMDAVLDAVVMIDSEGLIVEFNPAAEGIFGHRANDVVGQPMAELLVPPSHRRAHEKGMARYLATGKPRVLDRRLELPAMRADGSEFPAELSITRLPGSEPPVFVGSLRDITERVNNQRALRLAKEAAESANRAKSEFLAIMSHEIRTPLGAIMGMTELASDQAVSTDQQELLDIVETNAQSLLEVINEILDVSKIEAGRMEVTPAPTGLTDVLEDVCASLAPRAHAKGLELLFDLSPELPKTVMVDGLRLRQVAANLVGNAIKFTSEGWIHVRARAQESDDSSSVKFELDVSDTGPGIPVDRLEDVFERFVQLDSSTRREHGGSGLGLTISRSLAELMGGTIRVASEPGQGSSFVVEIDLPVVEAEASTTVSSGHRLVGRRTAIVTDRPRFADALRSGLRSLGASVVVTAPAEIESVRGCDLAILDAGVQEATWRSVRESLNAPELRLLPLVVVLPAAEGRPLLELAERAQVLSAPATRRRLVEAFQAATDDVARDSPTADGTEIEPSPEPVDRLVRVLLIEDHPDNRLYAVRVLESAGFRVDVASDGQEGLEKAMQTRYDVIFADIEMPVVDGLEFAERFVGWQREQGRQSVPIIALTAHAVAGFDERCRKAGMVDVVTKPARRETLVDAVHRHLAPTEGAHEPAAVSDTYFEVVIDADIADLVPAFLKSRADDVQRMEQWRADADYDAIRRCAHDTKASGASYGFPILTSLGARIGEAAVEGDDDALRLQLEHMRHYLGGVRWRAGAGPADTY